MDDNAYTYAGFWVRAGAAVVDTLLLMLITTPLLLHFYGWSYFTQEDTPWVQGPADLLISWVFPAVAVIGFWIKKQATPGKMALSCKVVDAATGQPASTGQLVVRYIGYYVAMLPLFLGIIWVAFDPRKQGWHDKLARTVVIKKIRSGPEKAQFNLH